VQNCTVVGIHMLSERGKMEDTHPGKYLYEVLGVVDETEVESDVVSVLTLLNDYLCIKPVTESVLLQRSCGYNLFPGLLV